MDVVVASLQFRAPDPGDHHKMTGADAEVSIKHRLVLNLCGIGDIKVHCRALAR